jgi:competence protein ComEA
MAGIGFGILALAGVGIVSTWAHSGMLTADGHQALSALGPLLRTQVGAVPGSSTSASASAPAAAAAPKPSQVKEAAPAPGTPPGITADGKIILNLASADDLQRLPGVGKKRAEAILALRARLRGFKRMSDLLRIRGIGPRSLKRMLPEMVLDAPKAAESPKDSRPAHAPTHPR